MATYTGSRSRVFSKASPNSTMVIVVTVVSLTGKLPCAPGSGPRTHGSDWPTRSSLLGGEHALAGAPVEVALHPLLRVLLLHRGHELVPREPLGAELLRLVHELAHDPALD